MEHWIGEQAVKGTVQFDKELEQLHPEFGDHSSNVASYLKRIVDECNYCDAIEVFAWNDSDVCSGRVLDLGCGGGWLAAKLSTLPAVDRVYALDASRGFLTNLLPDVVRELGGVEEKIKVIEGLFTPLLFDDGFLDVVVGSSVFHHADNLEALLIECRRVLKVDGMLFILNETPYSGLRHLVSTTKGFVRIFFNLCFRKYYTKSPSISSSGYYYDPNLGDRDYPIWYWHAAIARSGFELVETIDTGLSTIKGTKSRLRTLKHFVCRAV